MFSPELFFKASRFSSLTQKLVSSLRVVFKRLPWKVPLSQDTQIRFTNIEHLFNMLKYCKPFVSFGELISFQYNCLKRIWKRKCFPRSHSNVSKSCLNQNVIVNLLSSSLFKPHNFDILKFSFKSQKETKNYLSTSRMNVII